MLRLRWSLLPANLLVTSVAALLSPACIIISTDGGGGWDRFGDGDGWRRDCVENCSDRDGDGLSDEDEDRCGTNPDDADSDDDGVLDRDEDGDGDGWSNGDEQDGGSDPADPADP